MNGSALAGVVSMVWSALGLAACGAKATNKEDRAAWMAIRDAHKAELSAVCLPVLTAAAGGPPASAVDRIDVAGPLTSKLNDGNAVVMTDQRAAYILDRTDGATDMRWTHKVSFVGGTVFRPSPDFANLCAWVVEGRAFAGAEPDGFAATDVLQTAIARFGHVRYVLVPRVVAYTRPSDKGGVLTAGRMSCDVRVLDTKGVDHGGFRFEAISSDKVSYVRTVQQASGREVDNTRGTSMDDDLEKNARLAFDKALAAAIPGSEVVIY